MKIVFSRKGFDSTAGGYPSLIFPDGSLFSIPIPSSKDHLSYTDLEFEYEGHPIQCILSDLTGNKIRNSSWKTCNYQDSSQKCHFDPMPISVDGQQCMALGQVGSSEGHLRNQGVTEGDQFLFYGWYRPIEYQKGTWVYATDQHDIHLIWACMTVGVKIVIDTEALKMEALERFPYLLRHPHIDVRNLEKRNVSKDCIYLSREARMFNYSNTRCLTDIQKYEGRSKWRLPACFNQPQAFTFLNNFDSRGPDVLISYKGYGQEFVLDLDKIDSNANKESVIKHLEQILN